MGGRGRLARHSQTVPADDCAGQGDLGDLDRRYGGLPSSKSASALFARCAHVEDLGGGAVNFVAH
jgi:hypothetical protein